MSDFLDRLIERSLGLSPVVRPRLPSLFEPPGLDAGIQAEPADADAAPTMTSAHRAADADAHAPTDLTDAPRSLRHSPPREFPPPAADEPNVRPVIRPVQTPPPAAPRIEPDDFAPPEPQRPANTNAPRPSRQETRTQEPPPFQPAPRPPRVAPRAEVENVAGVFTPPRAADEHSTTVIHLTQHEPAAAPPKPFEPPPRREPVAQSGSNTAGQLSELGQQVEGLRQQVGRMQFRPAASEIRVETRAVEGERVVERVVESHSSAPPRDAAPEPAGRRPAQAQSPVFVQPRATQRAAPQFEAQEHANARAQEPTVNVTIGRIEIRAAQSAEAPARQERREQAPAAMSLRDYLRKRSGGHSR